MSVPTPGRAGVPSWRALRSALPRPRLSALLDRESALTMVFAPAGFGKRTLVASWLHAGGAPDRSVLWVPPLPDDATEDEVWAVVLDCCRSAGLAVPEATTGPRDLLVRVLDSSETPIVLVLSGVPVTTGRTLIAPLLDLLDESHTVDVIACMQGSTSALLSITARGIDSTFVSADDLAFTREETTELFHRHGVTLHDAALGDLHNALGGVPALVSAAAAVVRNRPTSRTGQHGLPDPGVAALLDKYVDERLARLGPEHRAFALSIAAASRITPEDAVTLTGRPDAGRLMVHLETVGLMVGSFGVDAPTWWWPPALRERVMAVSRRENPGRLDELLARLARSEMDADRPSAAALYAAESGNWALAAEIVRRSWVDMASNRFGELVRVMRALPDDVLVDNPELRAGRALVTSMIDDHPILGEQLVDDPATLTDPARHTEAVNHLYVATAQTIALRRGGRIAEAATRTLQFEPLVSSITARRPAAFGEQLPLLRMQWALTLQLAGHLPEATTIFRRAYQSGVSYELGFVAHQSAGGSALGWALAGDNTRVREWLDRARRYDNAGSWSGTAKVSGRTAAVLQHLDVLDLAPAKETLELLGRPNVREELWAFVAYAHSQYALATHDAYSGLTWLHQAIAAHSDKHSAGAFSRVLLTAVEVDLQLALGNGNLARATVDEEPSNHPFLVVAAARVELLTGHPEVASKLLKRVSWTDCGYPRAHLEALLLEAAAQVDRDGHDDAVRAWNRACMLSVRLGNRRAFTTLPPRYVETLVAWSGTAVPGGPVESIFVDTIARVELSPREAGVLALLARGSTLGEIAKELFVSPNTVKTQLRSIYRKLGVHTRYEAVGRARELRLLPTTDLT
ncbi:helix-turn-helix transcriptional regulator [Rhodococcus sp. CX]|uniref:LuxR C-terminal-related transcriptional regulator n=1 Tax=Rhodococcus sp. CX TaxID=2789880 RepID=UPI0018CDB163|nr:LuxR C-terminal-related transcriptional regulator [Rhodococcus sp. CX]MBH0121148.1 helix-turn-helix transcriptional regulator [Rhodococcus sp. CX]